MATGQNLMPTFKADPKIKHVKNSNHVSGKVFLSYQSFATFLPFCIKKQNFKKEYFIKMEIEGVENATENFKSDVQRFWHFPELAIH